MPEKSIFFSETETENSALSREELLKEISRATALPASPLSKLLEIRYLMRHYFIVAKDEELSSE